MVDSQRGTRLILSNLPPSLTNDQLRQHVARCPPQPPQLTDVKLLLKPDGTFRRMAFIGFKNSDEADTTRRWLQGSYVHGSSSGARIKVDWAKETHDAPRPHKRTRLASPSTSAVPLSASSAASASPMPLKDDQDRFSEFMAVMAPRRGRALDIQSQPQGHQVQQAAPEQAAPRQRSPDALNVAIVSSTSREAPRSTSPDARDDGAAGDDALTDLEYMARRMKRALVESDEELETDEQGLEEQELGATESATPRTTAWKQDDEFPMPAQPSPASTATLPSSAEEDARALILQTGRLFLRNLAYDVSEQELRELLEPFGPLERVHIPLDRQTQKAKGIAYTTFSSAEDAARAHVSLDGRSFQGRLLHILPAAGRQRDEKDPPESESTVKGQRLDARKRDSAKGLSWATLYMNSDAVMSSVADRLQLTKSQLLDPTSNNAAVRMALAETHVIAETKKYFEQEGVDLSCLTSRGPRSATTIMVKNIPYNTPSSALSALFTPHGNVRRLLLPPAGTIAIVEMEDGAAAASAWRSLAYKKLGNSVLYLEKAATGIWNGTPPAEPAAPAVAAVPSTAALATSSDVDGEPGSTLFVKNLSFATTNASLAQAFEHLPEFLFARVQTKPDPKSQGQSLSMGFGFVGFRTVAAATTALKSRDKHLLDGHQLEVRFAQRGKESSKPSQTLRHKSDSTSTKLIVKNVPFEVSRKEIHELFSAYGQLKSVRLPRKLDRKTRGFAFLDFASRRDAEAAFDALEHTHLLGRHLVLQWAEEDQADVEDLRARTGFFEGKDGSRKAKFSMEHAL